MDKKIEFLKSKSLEELTLDSPLNKYELINAVMRWAQELKQKGLVVGDPRQVLEQALKDIITGQISVEQIRKLPVLIMKLDEDKDKPGKNSKTEKEEPAKKEVKGKKSKK